MSESMKYFSRNVSTFSKKQQTNRAIFAKERCKQRASFKEKFFPQIRAQKRTGLHQLFHFRANTTAYRSAGATNKRSKRGVIKKQKRQGDKISADYQIFPENLTY